MIDRMREAGDGQGLHHSAGHRVAVSAPRCSCVTPEGVPHTLPESEANRVLHESITSY